MKEELYNIPDNASVTSNFNGQSEPITTYTATNPKYAQEIMQNGFTLPQSNADATSFYGSGIYTVGDTRVLKSGVYGDTIIQCQLLNPDDYKKFNSAAEARKAIENGYNGDIAVMSKTKGLMYITRNPNNVKPMRIINTKDNQNFMNESKLRNVIKESVIKVLKEMNLSL